MGCQTSRPAAHSNPSGAGADGWAAGEQSTFLPKSKRASAPSRTSTSTASRATTTARTAQEQRQESTRTTEAARTTDVYPNSDQEHSFSTPKPRRTDVAQNAPLLPAFVLCDFQAEPESPELSVLRGDFVSIEIDAAQPPPPGWCLCRRPNAREELADTGLVPWSHLVSAAHAEMAAVHRAARAGRSRRKASRASRSTAGSRTSNKYSKLPEDDVVSSGSKQQSRREVPVRRSETGFGIDINEQNLILRVVKGGAAEQDGLLRVGDLILGVDGERLRGRWLPELLSELPPADAYTFLVLTPNAPPETPTLPDHPEPNGHSSFDVLSTRDLSDIYALKSWNISDMKNAAACDHVYVSFEGRSVPVSGAGSSSGVEAVNGAQLCTPSAALASASGSTETEMSRATPSVVAANEFPENRLFSAIPSTDSPVHALLIINVQNDFIDGALPLKRCAAGQDAAAVIPVINKLRNTVKFDLVAVCCEAHPMDHCSFHETVVSGRSPVSFHPSQSPEAAAAAKPFDVVVLTGPDGKSKMPQQLWPRHCVTGTDGAQPPSSLWLQQTDIVIRQGTASSIDSFSAFYDRNKSRQTGLLQELLARGVTHVWLCGVALDTCVAYTALHAAEEGFATVLVEDACRGARVEEMELQKSMLQSAGVTFVSLLEAPEWQSLTSMDDAVAAATNGPAVRALMHELVERTGTPAHGVRREKPSALARIAATEGNGVYRISGHTVPEWVFQEYKQELQKAGANGVPVEGDGSSSASNSTAAMRPPGLAPRSANDSGTTEAPAEASDALSSSEGEVSEPDSARRPPPPPTGFKLNLGLVKREPVDDSKPLAMPHTPKGSLVARLQAAQGQSPPQASACNNNTVVSPSSRSACAVNPTGRPEAGERQQDQTPQGSQPQQPPQPQQRQQGKKVQRSQPFWASDRHRPPPKPVAEVTTMRMEQMLAAAMEGAAADPGAEAHFRQVMGRFQKHPGVLRKEKEREANGQSADAELDQGAAARQMAAELEERKTAAERAEREATEARAAEQLAAEQRVAEERAAEQRAAEERAAEERAAAERRAAEQKAAAAASSKPAVLPLTASTSRSAQPIAISPSASKDDDDLNGDSSDVLSTSSEEELSGPITAQSVARQAPFVPKLAVGQAMSTRQEQQRVIEKKVCESLSAVLAHSPHDEGGQEDGEDAQNGDAVSSPTTAAQLTQRSDMSSLPVTPRMAGSTGNSPPESSRSTPVAQSRSKSRTRWRDVELLSHLGAGSCGVVYYGRNPGTNEEVAVKILPLQLETAEDLKREIKVMRECKCEYIVGYRDAFMRDHEMRNALWVVMEFCHGGSALDVMRRQRIPLTEAMVAHICSGVLLGLEYLHTERKAIHRDVKAANVLLTHDGEVKLADLGVVAQLVNTMSKRGTMVGTPHWMAPEILGASEKYDTKVDVWAVGITAIELSEMQPPHAEATSVYATMMRIVQGPPATLKPTTDASDTFRDFVRKVLVKSPSQRPTAADLLQHDFVKGTTAADLRELVYRQLSEKEANANGEQHDESPGINGTVTIHQL